MTTRKPISPNPDEADAHLYQARHAAMTRRTLTNIAKKLLSKSLYEEQYNPAFSLGRAATWYKPKNRAYFTRLLERLNFNVKTHEYKYKTADGKPDIERFVDDLSDNLSVTDMNALRDYFLALKKYNANVAHNRNNTAKHRRALNARAVKKYRKKQEKEARKQTAGVKENLVKSLTKEGQGTTTLTPEQKRVQAEQAEKMRKTRKEQEAAEAKRREQQKQEQSQLHHDKLLEFAATGIRDEGASGLGNDLFGLSAFQRVLKDTREVKHFYKEMLEEVHGNRDQLYIRALATGAKMASDVEQQGAQTQTLVPLDSMVINGQIQNPEDFEIYYGRGRQARRLFYARLLEMLVLQDKAERGEN